MRHFISYFHINTNVSDNVLDCSFTVLLKSLNTDRFWAMSNISHFRIKTSSMERTSRLTLVKCSCFGYIEDVLVNLTAAYRKIVVWGVTISSFMFLIENEPNPVNLSVKE